MTNKYFKLKLTVPTAMEIAEQVANIFLDHRIILLGIPNYMLTNDPQFLSKFFATICEYLEVKIW